MIKNTILILLIVTILVISILQAWISITRKPDDSTVIGLNKYGEVIVFSFIMTGLCTAVLVLSLNWNE